MEIKNRNEVDMKYTWDTRDIYKTHDEFLADIESLKVLNGKVVNMKGMITASSANLEEYFHLEEDMSIIMTKLYSYAYGNHDVDMTLEEATKDIQLLTSVIEKISIDQAFITNEFLDASKERVMSLLNNDYLLSHKYNLENLFRKKKHILSTHDEELISKLEPAFTDNNEAMSLLKDTDLRFPEVKDENGKLVELTLSNYSSFISSKNRTVRKNAFYAREETLASYRDVFTQLLYKELKANNTIIKLRGYKDNLASAMFPDNLSEEIYYNLIKSVNDSLPYLHKYHKIRKELLGLDDYCSYDMNVSINDVKDTEFDFEKGKELVIKATSVLGEGYTKNISKAFDERWIDVYSSRSKISGGYMRDCYSVHPYILLNYQNKFNDVSTLAHELGHAMHSYYSDKANPIYNSDYATFVAEVASTTNEVLLANYVLNNTSDIDLKLEVLNNLIDTIDGTIYRQTMFAEFEDFLYKTVENDEPFTKDVLGEKYLSLLKKYNGNDVDTLEVSKDSWSRVDHFYYGYYVYKYATSMAAALAISKKILKGDKEAVESYLKMLSLGGSEDPLDQLKVAGVDLSKASVISDALGLFDNYVDKYYELIGQKRSGACE